LRHDGDLRHLATEELEAGLDALLAAPADHGRVALLVRRPNVGERETPGELRLDVVEGVVGDNWSLRGSSSTADGSANPEAQLTVMSARLASLVAGGEDDRRQLAGDQIYADLDLSHENLPPGSRLRIGSAVVEVSAHPHLGCAKFVERFGKDAMRFVNSRMGRQLRLRGMNCKVVAGGVVRLGDTITKEGVGMTSSVDSVLHVDGVLSDLEETGFAIVEGFLAPEAVETAKSELDRILETTPYGRNDFEGHETRRVYALFAKTRAFDFAAVHPLVLAVLDKVLREYHLSAPVGISIGPGSPAQALHPDDATYPIPRPHAELVVNIMLPLVAFTAENGATRIVPGSHRWTDRLPDADELTVACPMEAGSALFFLGSLWHGGGANTTSTDRLGVILHYSAAWLRPVENHVLAVPPGIVRGLEPRLQELLGYNIASPFTGYVDGRHPRRLLEGLPASS
jgi:hypothetical protein